MSRFADIQSRVKRFESEFFIIFIQIIRFIFVCRLWNCLTNRSNRNKSHYNEINEQIVRRIKSLLINSELIFKTRLECLIIYLSLATECLMVRNVLFIEQHIHYSQRSLCESTQWTTRLNEYSFCFDAILASNICRYY